MSVVNWLSTGDAPDAPGNPTENELSMVLALSPQSTAPNVVPAAVSDLDLWDVYRAMLRVRRFEELAGQSYAAGKVGGFLHLAIGEEAVCVGATSVLAPHDH